MATAICIPAPGAIDAALAVIANLPEPLIERVARQLIDRLDEIDGDPDFEETGLEDDFCDHPADGPGCPIAEGQAFGLKFNWTGFPGDDDDAEDDDPAGGNVEDEPHDEETDFCLAGDDGCGPARDIQNGGYVSGSEREEEYPLRPVYGIDQTQGPINVREAIRAHHEAMRREPTGRGGAHV